MEKELETELKNDVKQFVQLWDDSVENRLEAARIYYNAASEHPESKAMFMDAFPQWSSLHWARLYEFGSGALAPELMDLHNWSLALKLSTIPVQHQRAIAKGGLKAYSSDHPGGVTVQLRNLTTPLLKHVYDKTGSVKSVTVQRKSPLTSRVKKDAIQYGAKDKDGSPAVKITRALLITKAVLTTILLSGRVLSAKQLRAIADKLESAA